MLLPFYAALALAILFYLILPLVGAVVGGLRWRRFRTLVLGLASSPQLTYKDLSDARISPGGGALGPYVMRGVMEALEGEKRLWVRSPEASAVVDFSHSPLYVLAPDDAALPLDSTRRAGAVLRFPWKRVRSFSEGTKMLLLGKIRAKEGQVIFVEEGDSPLVALSYDGDEDELVSRIVAGGRSRNELWNSLTFASWALGLALLSLLFIYSSKESFLPSVRFLAWLTAIAPLIPLAPPGMAFLFLGNAFWRNCLRIRIQRDLAKVSPLRRAAEGGREAEGWRALFMGGLAVLAVGLALVVNGVAAFVLYRLISS